MAEQQTFRMRITFAKQGRLALLSHLEVARAIERAVRRAQLPFAVSQGFSPHMKIAFGAALPVGVGGTHEMVDLQLLRYVRPEEALLALQKESVPDLMVKECVYIEPKAPAASAAFPLSTYRALLSAAPAQLPVPEQVHIIRKKKEKVLDVADFLVGEMLLEGASLTFTLEQKPSGSLRPDKLLAAFMRLRREHLFPAHFNGSRESLAQLKNITSDLIGRFCWSVETATRDTYGPGPLTRYSSNIVIPENTNYEIVALKGIAVYFVMAPREREPFHQEELKIVSDLVDVLMADSPLPSDALESQFLADWNESTNDNERLRVAIDQVASLTDNSALALHSILC